MTSVLVNNVIGVPSRYHRLRTTTTTNRAARVGRYSHKLTRDFVRDSCVNYWREQIRCTAVVQSINTCVSYIEIICWSEQLHFFTRCFCIYFISLKKNGTNWLQHWQTNYQHYTLLPSCCQRRPQPIDTNAREQQQQRPVFNQELL